jgi:hypothetical protein
MTRRLCLLAALAVLTFAGCTTTAPSLRPALSAAPAATARITARPTAPEGLVVTGADAPRNVPDPCALLTLLEIEQLTGADPEVGVRGFSSDDDSWTCEIQAVSGTDARVFVALYVNAAHWGWNEALLAEPGATALVHPSLVGVSLANEGVAVELDRHVLFLASGKVDGHSMDPDVLAAAAALIVDRLAP